MKSLRAPIIPQPVFQYTVNVGFLESGVAFMKGTIRWLTGLTWQVAVIASGVSFLRCPMD